MALTGAISEHHTGVKPLHYVSCKRLLTLPVSIPDKEKKLS